jgi:tungstate transport system substrate-binding protein
MDPRKVMENLFLLAGPADDPARAGDAATLSAAFESIADGGYPFISRGDGSGTNRREISIWKDLAIEPQGQAWYQESAVGQGQNLLVAADRGAYTLVDSATFITFRDRVGLEALLTDFDHPNVYTVTLVNPERHPGVNADAARAFADFLTGPAGRALIADFGRALYGESLFVPLSAVPAPP